jgi:hypothetical protein
LAEEVILTEDGGTAVSEPTVIVENGGGVTEVTYLCAACGMEFDHPPVQRGGEVYCCLGCANGTGCTCTAVV